MFYQYDKAVLFSGGLDSSCSLIYACKESKKRVLAIMVDYGQIAHKNELRYGKKFIKYVNKIFGNKVDLFVLKVSNIYQGVIKKFKIEAPFGLSKNKKEGNIPNRNLILVILAKNVCDMLRIPELYVGFGYKKEGRITAYDSKYVFVDFLNKSFEKLESFVGNKGHFYKIDNAFVKIVSPMYKQNQKKFIRKMLKQGWDLSMTITCQNNLLKPCGKCGACEKRRNIFDFKQK